jgi:exodeoxyribonuclease-5
LLEEVLTGETADRAEALENRARALLAQLGISEAARPEDGPHAQEMAATTLRAFAIPEIAACRSRLVPEMTVFSAGVDDSGTTYVGGVADAVAYQLAGVIDLVVDWKTDVSPAAQQIELYREQLRDYIVATGASDGLIVFVTTGKLVRVRRKVPPRSTSPSPAAAQLEISFE